MLTVSAMTAAGFAFTADRKALVAALATAARIVERRNTIPILSHVRLTVGSAGDALEIMATDLDLMTIQPLPIEHGNAGAVCAELRALLDAAKKMTGERVRLADIGGNRATLTDCATGATARFSTLPADDFPAYIGDMKEAKAARFALPAAQLRDDLDRVAHAISTEEARYYLNGVFFHLLADPRGQALRIAATDGHRLHYATRPVPEGAAGVEPEAGCVPTFGHPPLAASILPRKAVKTLLALLGKKPAGDVALRFAPAMFSLVVGDVTLRGKLIDGSFPDYTRVIPSQNERRLEIDSDALADGIATVTAACPAKAPAVKLSLVGGESGSVILSATCPESGTTAVEIVGATYTGEEIATGYNSAYLSTVCKALAGQRVIMEFKDAAAPALFYGETDGETFRTVLMPMRLCAAIFTRETLRKLNRNPVEILSDDLGETVAAAVKLSGMTYDRSRHASRKGATVIVQRAAVRRSLQAGSRAAWSAVGRMIADARAFAVGGGANPETVRQSIREMMAQALGDAQAVESARSLRSWIECGRPAAGSFRAVSASRAPVSAAPLVEIVQPEAAAVEPQPVEIEEAPAAAPVVLVAPAVGGGSIVIELSQDAPASDECPQTDPEPVSDDQPPADPMAAVLDRIAALEALVERLSGGEAPAPAPAAPEPVAAAAPPVEEAERATLEGAINQQRAEIGRLMALVADLTSERDQLKAKRGRTAGRLRLVRSRLRTADTMQRAQTAIAAAALRRHPTAPDVAPPAPRPSISITLPAVPRRPRVLVAA